MYWCLYFSETRSLTTRFTHPFAPHHSWVSLVRQLTSSGRRRVAVRARANGGRDYRFVPGEEPFVGGSFSLSPTE